MSTVQPIYQLADLIADVATAAFRKARQDLVDGKIDADAFNRATRQFNDSMDLSARIVAIGAYHAASELAELTAAVEEARDRIKHAISSINHATNALKIIANVLAFAASIVAAVAAPASIPGAVAAGLSLANTIHDVATAESA